MEEIQLNNLGGGSGASGAAIEQINVATFVADDKDGGGKKERDSWGSKTQFMLSCIGYAVGLGNVWRFPYLCYKNGGGAFLIPYALMLFLIGVPLFFLELSLGQRFQQGAWGCFRAMHPALSGIGGASLVVSFLVGLYYNVIICYYLYGNVVSPWDGYNCTENRTLYWPCSEQGNITQTEAYWFDEVLNASDSIDSSGGVVWKVVVSLFGAWVIVALCEIKGIQSAGYVVYFTATFPYVILFILFFKGVTLPGAEFAIVQATSIHSSDLHANVWADAASQILYSLSPGFGTLIAFASYNKKDNNCLKDAITVSLINCSTSFFAGFVIFSFLGFMAEKNGVAVGDVVSSGPGLAFQVYPEAVLSLPGSTFWAIMFFSMLLTLGLDSMFGTIEDLDVFHARKEVVTLTVCGLSFVCGLVFTARSGVYWFELFDIYSAGIPLMYVAEVEKMIGQPISRYWWWMWKWISPGIIIFILIWSIVEQASTQSEYSTAKGLVPFPAWAVFCGWGLILTSTSVIPIMAVYHRKKITFSFSAWCAGLSWARLKRELTSPPKTTQFGPDDDADAVVTGDDDDAGSSVGLGRSPMTPGPVQINTPTFSATAEA
eukprot:gene7766-21655_t